MLYFAIFLSLGGGGGLIRKISACFVRSFSCNVCDTHTHFLHFYPDNIELEYITKYLMVDFVELITFLTFWKYSSGKV